MKTLVRHGLAACLALTTMCTSLLLMYSGLGGGQKEHPQQREQEQAAAGASGRPAADGELGQSPQRPGIPQGGRLMDGYISVLDHKEDLQHLAQHWLVHNDDCIRAL
ncbi:alpha-N-acetylgalactosaminide alpha-2,6-sialyltransferase 5 isoform X2 [Vombatus ursinus]|uniref:alpha-N-acetylgalactosaminide alpha-2,6-sialyltransferase 5 isoform X2 n=1 Tax=Vombatus ursinus TaxID=29139 RepID=UPI000FFD0946|nr:alpha-N-acetylgalactosaminide alpha-2,6-sialyltransferase 5 isoform X2 [Vombatus ursinus]